MILYIDIVSKQGKSRCIEAQRSPLPTAGTVRPDGHMRKLWRQRVLYAGLCRQRFFLISHTIGSNGIV